MTGCSLLVVRDVLLVKSREGEQNATPTVTRAADVFREQQIPHIDTHSLPWGARWPLWPTALPYRLTA